MTTVVPDHVLQPPAAVRVPPAPGVDLLAEPVQPPGGPSWLRRHGGALVLVALLAVITAVHATGATRWPGFGDDEGTYVAQAWAVLNGQGLTHYTYWYDHPPLGWLQLAGLRGLAGPFLQDLPAVAAGRVLMLVPLVASCALLWLWARRLGLRVPAAALAVVLLGLSPLSVAFLRGVYLDTFALPWVLAAFALAATRRGRLWSYAGSGACFAVAVLTKETMLLLLPALLLQLWQTCDRRTRAFCVTAFGSLLTAVGLAYPLYAVLKGELFPGPDHVSLFAAVGFQLSGRASTGSPLDPSSAGAGLVAGWLALDPWLLAFGVLAAPTALLVRRFRPVAAAVILLVVVGLRPGYLPQPYVVALLGMCALLTAGLADVAVGPLRTAIAGRSRGALLRPVLALLVIGALAAAVAPDWGRGLKTATTTDANAAGRQATDFLVGQVDPRARVLVDDTYYVDLVEAGFQPQFGVVWFYKLDLEAGLDPSVAERLPRGWREFDYVVSSPSMRSALAQQPDGLQEVRSALESSEPVEVFGTGEGRVEVRRVVGPDTGSGVLASAAP